MPGVPVTVNAYAIAPITGEGGQGWNGHLVVA